MKSTGIIRKIDDLGRIVLPMELRKKMGLPGKHPGCKSCPNKGTDKCKCKDNAGKCSCGHDHGNSEDALVAEITRKVLAALGK